MKRILASRTPASAFLKYSCDVHPLSTRTRRYFGGHNFWTLDPYIMDLGKNSDVLLFSKKQILHQVSTPNQPNCIRVHRCKKTFTRTFFYFVENKEQDVGWFSFFSSISMFFFIVVKFDSSFFFSPLFLEILSPDSVRSDVFFYSPI